MAFHGNVLAEPRLYQPCLGIYLERGMYLDWTSVGRGVAQLAHWYIPRERYIPISRYIPRHGSGSIFRYIVEIEVYVERGMAQVVYRHGSGSISVYCRNRGICREVDWYIPREKYIPRIYLDFYNRNRGSVEIEAQ